MINSKLIQIKFCSFSSFDDFEVSSLFNTRNYAQKVPIRPNTITKIMGVGYSNSATWGASTLESLAKKEAIPFVEEL